MPGNKPPDAASDSPGPEHAIPGSCPRLVFPAALFQQAATSSPAASSIPQIREAQVKLWVTPSAYEPPEPQNEGLAPQVGYS